MTQTIIYNLPDLQDIFISNILQCYTFDINIWEVRSEQFRWINLVSFLDSFFFNYGRESISVGRQYTVLTMLES